MQRQSRGQVPHGATRKQLLLTLAGQLIEAQKNQLNSRFSFQPSSFLLRRHQVITTDVIELLISDFPDCPRWASRAVDQLLCSNDLLQEALD